MGIFPFFGKKLIKGDVRGIENQTISHSGSVIKNIVAYDTEKANFKFIQVKIAEYVDFLKKGSKTEHEMKLEKLGLTSSQSYNYNLNRTDEEYLRLLDTYREKYPNNVYVPEKLFNEMQLIKVYKKDFKKEIPSNIIDVLYAFKVDSDDYKIVEYADDDYGSRNPLPSPFSYSDIETAINEYWSTSYRAEYVAKLSRGERTFFGSGRQAEKTLLQKLKDLKIENYTIKEHYKAELNFFFLVSNPEDRKKTFKEFIGDIVSTDSEVLVMQPVRGGYLLMGNW